MILDVVSVIPQDDFSLDLTFANGEQRCFDMKPLLAMKPWQRLDNLRDFRRAYVDYGTVVWPGEIDVSPDMLYDQSQPIAMEKLACSIQAIETACKT